MATEDQIRSSHPDYRAGYEAGLRGEPMGIVSAHFDAGWEAGKSFARIFTGVGFTEVAPGQFRRTDTI